MMPETKIIWFMQCEELIACLEQRIMQAEVHEYEIGDYGTD